MPSIASSSSTRCGSGRRSTIYTRKEISDLNTPKPYVTKTGRVLNDADIEALATEVAGDIDVKSLKPRRRGRPPLEGGPAGVVPVRLDTNLRAAVEARATSDHTTTSDVIREALRRYLDVA